MKRTERTKELTAKSVADLQTLLAEQQEKLRDMRFRISQAQEKNVREFRKVKKDIARINTILNNKKEKQAEVVEKDTQK